VSATREKAEIRARMRERLGSMEDRLERPPPRRPAQERRGAWAEEPEEDRAPRSPLGGLLLLAVLPLAWPLVLFAGRRGELAHESWTFRLHDFAARHPTLGLTLYLGGALCLACAVAGLGAAALCVGWPLIKLLPWLPW